MIPKKPFPTKLSEFRPISSLSTMRKLLGYVLLAPLGDTQFNSFQTGFLRRTDASHGVFCLGESKRDGKGVEKLVCSWHNWTSRRPLTTYSTPSQPQDHNRKGHQSSCSRYSTSGQTRATLLSAWRGSPVTNASLSRGVSRRVACNVCGCF